MITEACLRQGSFAPGILAFRPPGGDPPAQRRSHICNEIRQRSAAVTFAMAKAERVTDQVIAELEKGVRPWMKPWNAEHAAGRITRPLRAEPD